MPIEQPKSRKFQNQPGPWSDRREHVTANLFIFLRSMIEDAFADYKGVFQAL